MPCTTFQKQLEALQSEAKLLMSRPADSRSETDRARIKAIPGEIQAAKASLGEELALEQAAADADRLLNKPAPGSSLNNNAGHPEIAAAKARQDFELVASQDEKLWRTGGFKSHGHLAMSLIKASDVGGRAPQHEAVKAIRDWTGLVERVASVGEDEEAKREAFKAHAAWKAASGMGTVADPTADVLVPMEFSQNIFKRREGIASDIMSRCSQMTIKGSSIRLPAWNDSARTEAYRAGGVIAYWEDEGDEATLTKIDKTRYKDFRPKRLTCGVYVTDELMADSPYTLDTYIDMQAAEAISYKTNQAIFEGNGVGRDKGILKSGAKIQVSKEASQTAATINADNIAKMWMRFSSDYRSNATWHINQDCETQFDKLYFATGANSGQLVYSPAGGLSQSGYATVKGRPLIPLEFCETLGTVGDIVLVDWSQVMVVSKGGGTKKDVSMHVKFLSNQQTFRYTTRMDCDCMWDAPVTPLKGSTTNSIIIVLETRS